MERKKIIIDNSLHEPQEFAVDVYEDHVKLLHFFNDGVSKNITQIDIPATIEGKPVTIIGEECFFHCNQISKVTFPDTILTIGLGAFAMCSGIEELILPDSITEIGGHAFRDCTSLKRIEMPSGLKVLPSSLFSFSYLSDDFEIILKEGLEIIETHVFFDPVPRRFKVKIPESVKTIARGAFRGGGVPITSLPYNEAWFQDWPYEEEVICDDFDMPGKIFDIYYLERGCYLYTALFGEDERTFFSPCDFADGIVSFVDEKSQKTMLDNIMEQKKADEENSFYPKMSDSYKIRRFWERGIVGRA